MLRRKQREPGDEAWKAFLGGQVEKELGQRVDLTEGNPTTEESADHSASDAPQADQVESLDVQPMVGDTRPKMGFRRIAILGSLATPGSIDARPQE